MQKLDQIAYSALISTSRNPRWWILALVQAVAFSVIAELARNHFFIPRFFFWLIISVIVLVPSTVWLWLDIDMRKDSRIKKDHPFSFKKLCFTTGSLLLSAIGLVIIARFIFTWVFLVLVSSVVSATAVLAMLYAVLCRQNFVPSLKLALDTWNKKISLAAAIAFVLILAHAASFAFFNGIWKTSFLQSGVEVFSHFGTIWVLSAILAIFVAFVAAFLNCFLIYLFLEIVLRNQSEKAESESVNRPLLEPNI